MLSREADITTSTQIKKVMHKTWSRFCFPRFQKNPLDFYLNKTLANAHSILKIVIETWMAFLSSFMLLVVGDTDLIICSSGSRSLQVLGASRNVTMWLCQLIWKVKSTCGGMNYVQTLASGKMWVIAGMQIELIWILSISNYTVYSVTLYVQYKLHFYYIAHEEQIGSLWWHAQRQDNGGPFTSII